MKVRRAGFSEELASLVRRIFPKAEPIFTEKDLYFVAEEKKIVGFIHIIDTGRGLLLQGIGVLPEWREKGIGGELLDAAVKFSELEGKDIFLKVKPDNPALNLYHKKGFTLKKIRDTYVLEKKRVN